MGLASLRLADYPVLPLNTTAYAFELPSYLKQLEQTASAHNVTSLDFSELSGAIEAVQAAAIALDAEVALLHAEFAALEGVRCHNKKRQKRRVLMRKLRSINRRKMAFERGFISAEGLPKRSWYKHLVVAPGYNLGYGATTMPGGFLARLQEWRSFDLTNLPFSYCALPGITEAITIFRDEEMAKQELSRLGIQLKASAAALKGTQ
jgi:N-acetylated-alpha-linked acidic dipeptidase